jgi:protein involved in polysaccharide export with SLBB domain
MTCYTSALIGSFNQPAVIELKPGDAVNDAIAYAGGLSVVADQRRVAMERLSERNDRRVTELSLPRDGAFKVVNGDVLSAFNSVSAALAQAKQFKRVRVEGEVAIPGDYVLTPTSTLMDAVRAAGGLTPEAYLFGTDFSRESVRRVQEVQYERALRDLETEFALNTSSQKVSSAGDAMALGQNQINTTRLVDRLRAVKPTGRIILDLGSASRELPSLTVEDGDRLYIPARPTTVGVFGSVFNGGSYLYTAGASVEDMLKQAGGPTRGADKSSIFVIRANGSVASAHSISKGWLNIGAGMANLPALPGDTVFVPEDMNKTSFMQEAKDWTQILYQLGLGAAALKTIRN